MRRFLLRSSFVILLSLVLVAPIAAKPRTFTQLVDAYFDDYFKANPSQATNAGLHKYDSQLLFSLQDFHDRFIKAGSPPVKIVRRELMGRDGPLL